MSATAEIGRTAQAAQLERIGRVGYALGAALVVAGGLVAAVTSPLALAKGSWLAAYLVLVCGVAQCMLASQRPTGTSMDAATGRLRLMLVGWNAGNALVIVGVLTAIPIVVDVGGVVLLAVLVTSLVETRHAAASARIVLLRVALVLLIASIPIGLVLAHARAAS
ncbi:MAG TPA: hypothetical protein VI121_05300 [Agromyces sp.]